jgi:hypothetical protein
MKKLLLLMAVAVLPCLAGAQTMPDTTRTRRAAEEYCSITPHGKAFSSKLTVDVDYGQSADDEEKLVDSDRKVINFKSPVDALNYMARQGWVYVNSIVTDKGVTYFLRRKLVSAE